MKWLLMIGVMLLSVGCCCQSTEYVAYRQVAVTPTITYKTVAVTPMVEPVMVNAGYIDPLDVSTTTIDFY